MNIEREAELFTRIVDRQGDYDPWSEAAHLRILSVFERLVNPRQGERCVEMGCGTGAFSRNLVQRGLQLVGIDICPLAVERARENIPEGRFFVQDIRESGLSGRSIDIAVFSGVLHHFPLREDRAAALREAFRLLKPGGRLFSYDPNSFSPAMWLYRSKSSPFSQLFSGTSQTEEEILIHPETMRDELSSAGFAPTEIRAVGGITLKNAVNPIGKAIRPFYNFYENLTLLPFLERDFGSLLLTAAVKPSA